MDKDFILNDLDDSRKLAHQLAKNLEPGDIITFHGDLGSGKTFLCKEIVRFYCGQDTKVPSPTFNILQIYNTKNFNIYHYDLYRLKSAEELLELGFEEALEGNVCLIEWPQIAQRFLPIGVEVHLRIENEVRICNIKNMK